MDDRLYHGILATFPFILSLTGNRTSPLTKAQDEIRHLIVGRGKREEIRLPVAGTLQSSCYISVFKSVAFNNIVIFFFNYQNNQADLENATEVLSGYLERDISQDSLQDIKQKVQDKYRSVKEE